MSTPSRWLVGLVGLVLLVGAPTAWYVGQPAETAGALPDGFTIAGSDDASIGSGDDRDRPDDPADAAPEHDALAAPTAPAPSGTAPPARPSKPLSVSLPAIGVETARVVEVGLDAERAVEIPDDVREVGWYGKGPRPGEDGNAFMTSHVDSRTQGRGVLFDLRRSEPGDPIVVTHEDRSVSEWTVVARERIRKGNYPLEQVFRFDGPPGLVIDTCGGAFDTTRGSYEQIDIVYAVPADDPHLSYPHPA